MVEEDASGSKTLDREDGNQDEDGGTGHRVGSFGQVALF